MILLTMFISVSMVAILLIIFAFLHPSLGSISWFLTSLMIKITLLEFILEKNHSPYLIKRFSGLLQNTISPLWTLSVIQKYILSSRYLSKKRADIKRVTTMTENHYRFWLYVSHWSNDSNIYEWVPCCHVFSRSHVSFLLFLVYLFPVVKAKLAFKALSLLPLSSSLVWFYSCFW